MNYGDVGISIPHGRTTGQVKVTCPQCSSSRRNKADKCLSVNLDEKVWKCHHCSWSGRLVQRVQKEYKRPAPWTNNTPLSEQVVRWFENRKISQKTLVDAKIQNGLEWMPQTQTEVNTIQFPYYKDGQLVNIKYRDKDKNFKMFSGGELVFMGIDDIDVSKPVIIVEGEMDWLSLKEIGITNVLSVPNGATLSRSAKLEYVDNSFDKLNECVSFVIATDDDEAGRMLRKELARRLGHDKCYYLEWGEHKDANGVLVQQGAIALEVAVGDKNWIPYPVEGVVEQGTLRKDVDDLFEVGLKPGRGIGHADFDKLLTFEPGYVTMVTGIPSHGKSSFLDHLLVRLALRYSAKAAMFSPEHQPTALHASRLMSKVHGRWFSKKNMTMDDMREARDYIVDNFFFINSRDESFTLDRILDTGVALVRKFGIEYFVIDPWNRIEHQCPPGEPETLYISKCLDKIDSFSKTNSVHTFVVAHPTKIKKDKNTGAYEIPTPYDIAGSAHFFNKPANAICVYRDFVRGITDVHVQKVKFNHWGEQGTATFKWNESNGRYYQQNDASDETNWLRVIPENVSVEEESWLPYKD